MTAHLLTIPNRHSTECGDPAIDIEGKFVSYFTSRNRDQWVFVGDYGTMQVKLYGGDVGWDQVVELSADQMISPYMHSEDELFWLMSCWMSFRRITSEEFYRDFDVHHAAWQRGMEARMKAIWESTAI